MNTLGHSPSDIQSHLYLSFLRGCTADVALQTKGRTWEAVYHLHRVVLIQAGFFRSLFAAGFLESQQHDGTGRLGSPPVEVNISFDDLNITRSAFEVCIARLYGGGPELHLSPALVPTPVCPLTPSFFSIGPMSPSPAGHHPATPRFLLSLLATSVYLSIPSITSQALSMILSSIGPYTVSRYLNFAIGRGIGPSEGDDPDAAVGLEEVGKDVHTGDDTQSSMIDGSKYGNTDDFDVIHKLCSLDLEGNVDREDDPSGSSYPEEPSFNYGGIGDKVGEACACWLMRWGADILPCEENADSQTRPTPEPLAVLRSEAGPSRRFVKLSSASRSSSSKVTPPKLWARGGLTAPWVSTVISSNDFFIKDEWQRYEFATRVVTLRRRDGLDPREEKEWARLFQHGIHYSNMSMEELIRISQDISSDTGRPYITIETIHTAHWMQSTFRHRIVTRSPVTGTGSPPQSPDKQLGITLSTSDILAILSSDATSEMDKSKSYYPIPVDSSQRVGDSDNAFATAAAPAALLLGSASEEPGQGNLTPRQGNFFGILSEHYTAATCIQADATGNARWSPYSPFRFAVEFWGVGQLLEKSRLHSHTIWYAGSLFNVYVQVVRKKGVQLGLYLHRQSSVDPMPRASAPLVPISTRAERLLNTSPTPRSPPNTPQNIRSQSPTQQGHAALGFSASTSSVAFAIPGSPRPPASPPTTNTITPSPAAPLQPYRDPRPSVLAYFTISCASATGSSLTRFSSSPDQFSIGQSWGWKSSSLQSEEYPELDGEAKATGMNLESSLRATIVIGLI